MSLGALYSIISTTQGRMWVKLALCSIIYMPKGKDVVISSFKFHNIYILRKDVGNKSFTFLNAKS